MVEIWPRHRHRAIETGQTAVAMAHHPHPGGGRLDGAGDRLRFFMAGGAEGLANVD